MAITFQRAKRSKAKLRLAIAGPSGSGKTYSSLLIASGIVPMEKVAVIDTESGSADLYADLGAYSTVTIQPPYSPQKYIEAIHAAEDAGFELVIIDSLSHAWSGQGGLLDQQGKAADTKYRGNSWAAWREITPQHNLLVDAMLHTKCHLIATMRSKADYIQTETNGRKRIEKVGMAPIQRDGIEYEFTTVFDLSQNHTATVSKDRTKLFDGQYFVPNQDVGKALLHWLNVWETQPIATQNQVPEERPAPSEVPNSYRVRLERIWTELGWSATQKLDEYVALRLKEMHQEERSVAQATIEDWKAINAEITNYLNQNQMNHVAAAQTGEPLAAGEEPF